MEITSLIFSILGFVVGVIGLLVSYFGWHYVKKITFNPQKFCNEVAKQLKRNPEMENPYSLNGDFIEQSKYCFFNMVKNLHLYD